MGDGYMGETWVGALAHSCGLSKEGTDGPPSTPHGTADYPLGAPMGGNQ